MSITKYKDSLQPKRIKNISLLAAFGGIDEKVDYDTKLSKRFGGL